MNGRWRQPDDVEWQNRISVPFAPETPASGINDNRLYKACWYRKTIQVEPLPGGHKLLLHFGAVDFVATVWCNGRFVGRHEGGYTPFTVDLTFSLFPQRDQ